MEVRVEEFLVLVAAQVLLLLLERLVARFAPPLRTVFAR
jgi:hypothetical protein